MSEERIVITVREDGSRVVSRNLREIGTSSLRSQRSVMSLTGALHGLISGLAINQVRRWLDTWTAARGKVNIFTETVQETNNVLDQLVKVANDARQPLDATVNSFHQMTLAASALGASQKDLLGVTSSVNKVFAIQGTTAQTARGGIIQFGQAMTEGIVRAQEYNSMINAMPLLLVTVAKHLEGAGGSVAKLRKMMLAGELTSRKFFEAIKAGQKDIDALFERSGKTIGQGFTLLENAIIQYLGKLDQSIGFSRTLFELMKFGAENIQLLATALAAVASPVILRGLAAVTLALRGMLIGLAANPILLVASAIAAATVALATYKDQIIIVQDEQLTLGDFMNSAWSMAKEGAVDFASAIMTVAAPAVDFLKSKFPELTLTWADVGSFLKKAINMWIGWFVGLPKVAIAAWKSFPAALANTFKDAFNFVSGVVENNINTMIRGANFLREKTGMDKIAEVQFDRMEVNAKDTFANIGKDIKNIMSESLSTDFLGEGFDKLIEGARVFGEQRKKDLEEQLRIQKELDRLLKQPKGTGEDFAPTGKGKGIKDEFDNPRTLANNLRRLLNTIQPMAGAVLEYARAQKILNAAVKEGMITDAQRTQFLELVENHYRDIVDPVGAVNRELQREGQMLQLSNREREIAVRLFAIEEDLRKQGVLNIDAETAAIKEQLIALQRQAELSGALDQIRAATTDRVQDIVTRQQALQIAHEKGAISLEYYNSQLAQSNVEMATLMNQMGNGDQFTVMTEALGSVLQGYTTVASGVASILGNTFSQMADGISNSLARAIVMGDNLRDSMHQVAGTILVEMISALIKLGIQYVINAALGQAAASAAMAASIAQATAVAAAWQPAMVATSLASFGANSGPAIAGMAAATIAAKSLSAMPSFDGGGFTGDDPRSGGLDGKGGFLAMMHPKEVVSDLTKGQTPPNNENRKTRELPPMTFNFYGVQDADSFRRSESQIAARMGQVINRASERNN